MNWCIAKTVVGRSSQKQIKDTIEEDEIKEEIRVEIKPGDEQTLEQPKYTGKGLNYKSFSSTFDLRIFKLSQISSLFLS